MKETIKTTVQFLSLYLQMVLFSAQVDELMGISHRNVATILWHIFLESRFGESCLSFVLHRYLSSSQQYMYYVKFSLRLVWLAPTKYAFYAQ